MLSKLRSNSSTSIKTKRQTQFILPRKSYNSTQPTTAPWHLTSLYLKRQQQSMHPIKPLSKHPITFAPSELHTPTAMGLFPGFICRLSMHPLARLAISNMGPVFVPTITGPTGMHSGLLINLDAIQPPHVFKNRLVTNLHDILGTRTPSTPSKSLDTISVLNAC
jgi:hypothetical protein